MRKINIYIAILLLLCISQGFLEKYLANGSTKTPTLDELHKTLDEQHAAKTTDR